MTIGVFFGSGSVEHDISIITGSLVIQGLRGIGYNVVPVYISKQGRWMLGEELGNLKLFFDPSKKPEDMPGLSEYYLDMRESVGKMVFRKKGILGKSVQIDLAFPALHGTYGEDGSIQGLFEMLGVPYVGCGVTASAVAMDKALTKVVMKEAGVPTTKFISFSKFDWENQKSKIKNQIGGQVRYPVFVKPVHLGSSIGMGRAANLEEFERQVEVSLFYDDKIIVEEAVENLMDVTCCVIGNEKPEPSLLQESVFSKDMFSFDDKYLEGGGAQTGKNSGALVIPARLDEEFSKGITGTALEVYKALGCSGIARVDFLVDTKSKLFFANEVNPMPGTVYHHLWKASGLELEGLLTKLIKFAEEKYKQKRSINFTFESSLLTNLGKGKLGSKILS